MLLCFVTKERLRHSLYRPQRDRGIEQCRGGAERTITVPSSRTPYAPRCRGFVPRNNNNSGGREGGSHYGTARISLSFLFIPPAFPLSGYRASPSLADR